VLLVRLSEAFRAPMVDLVNRIIHQHLLIANFSMHPDEGTPRWQVSLMWKAGRSCHAW